MKDLRRRTVTALVYGAIVVAAVLAPPPVLWALLGVAGVVGISELVKLRTPSSIALGALFVAGLASIGALRAFGARDAHHAAADGLPVWLFFVLVPTWAADVTAYAVGSRWGTRRIAPRVSPGKTWEGTLAGLLACFLAAFGLAALFGLPKAESIALAVVLGPIGFAGDLLESYVKRRAGVKDSGTLLPGHGGVLDRLDSLSAASTAVALVVAASHSGMMGP